MIGTAIRLFRGRNDSLVFPARAVELVPEDTLVSEEKRRIDFISPLSQPVEKIAINRADMETLISLPGIGPVLARKIIEDRQMNGPYRKPEDLLRVKGIGQKKLERLREWITCEVDGVEKREKGKEGSSRQGVIKAPESF